MSKTHEIFYKFQCWKGTVPAGYACDFLGIKTNVKYYYHFQTDDHNCTRDVETTYPIADNDEYFEWIDLLEAVVNSGESFTMIELGAGFGRWLCRAATALKQRNLASCYKLIGVEAEPTHFQWMKEHLQHNGIDLQQCSLIEAAVDGKDGNVQFRIGNADHHYGQSIASRPLPNTQEVKAISLPTILKDLERVDLIDLDVQDAEFKVLSSAMYLLDNKVKRVHIGTHSKAAEYGLKKLFNYLGWVLIHDFTFKTEYETEYGQITFGDGVQSWINPKFHHDKK